MTSIYENVHPVVGIVCCPNQQGWFVDAGGRVERCDDCKQFPHDEAADEHVRATVTVCVDCEQPFADNTRHQRSEYCPALCNDCLCDEY